MNSLTFYQKVKEIIVDKLGVDESEVTPEASFSTTTPSVNTTAAATTAAITLLLGGRKGHRPAAFSTICNLVSRPETFTIFRY